MERGDSESVEWSDEMTLTLIEVLLDEMKRGTRSDTGFKLSSYQRVREQVNLTKDWKGRTPNVSLVHVKNKFNNMKKDWKMLNTVKDLPDVQWNNRSHTMNAGPAVWLRIIQEFPRANKFRGKVFRFYDSLTELLGGDQPPPVQDSDLSPSRVGIRIKIGALGYEGLTLPDNLDDAMLASTADENPPRSYSPASHSEPEIESQVEPSEVPKAEPRAIPQPIQQAAPRPTSSFESDGLVPDHTLVAHSKKRRKYNRQITSTDSISGWLGNMTQNMTSNALTTIAFNPSMVQRAVILLQEEYSDKFDIDKMVDAINIFVDERKAELFLTIANSSLRDRWVEHEIIRVRRREV